MKEVGRREGWECQECLEDLVNHVALTYCYHANTGSQANHIFCVGCIGQLAASGGQIICPMCQGQVEGIKFFNLQNENF